MTVVQAALGPMVAWGSLALVGWVSMGLAGVPRGSIRAVASVPVALAVIVALGLVQLKVPVPFHWSTVAILAWTLGGAVGGLRRLRTPSPEADRSGGPSFSGERGWGWVLLALAGSAAVGFFVVWSATGYQWAVVSQTWDAYFDANAVRAGWETQVLAPTRISEFAYPSALGNYYPSAFHSLAVFVMQVTGADAVSAANMAAGLLAGAVWPATAALAALYIMGGGRRTLVGGLVLAWGFHGMPWSPLGWGVLWATGLAGTAVPFAVATFAGMLGVTRVPRSRALATLLFIPSLGLVAVLHPRIAVVTSAVLCAPWVWHQGGRAIMLWRGSQRPWAAVRVLLALLPLAILAVAALVVGRTNGELVARAWPILQGRLAELAQYAIGGPAQSVPQIFVALLVAVGVVVAWREPGMRWLVVLLAAAIALDVATATTNYVRPFNALARFWYNDRHRTIVVPPTAAVLLAVMGLTWVQGAVDRRLAHGVRRKGVVAVVAALTVTWGAWGGLTTLRPSYADASADPRMSFVSQEDRQFYARVAEVVPAGQRVLNNPWDGSGLLFAYTGVRPVFMLLNGTSSTYNGVVLRDHLVTMSRADACTYLKADSVHWVLNGGQVSLSSPDLPPQVAPGMQIPETGFWATTLVLSQGDLRLYQVTGCGSY